MVLKLKTDLCKIIFYNNCNSLVHSIHSVILFFSQDKVTVSHLPIDDNELIHTEEQVYYTNYTIK